MRKKHYNIGMHTDELLKDKKGSIFVAKEDGIVDYYIGTWKKEVSKNNGLLSDKKYDNIRTKYYHYHMNINHNGLDVEVDVPHHRAMFEYLERHINGKTKEWKMLKNKTYTK